MAHVIPFRIKPDRRKGLPVPHGGAKVLIFTGVRYERTETAGAAEGVAEEAAEASRRQQSI